MKIVMYHYVRPQDADLPHFNFLHVDDFARQLDFFQSSSNILSPAALFEALQTGILPEGYLLTFDDGLKDHYEFVLPELIKRGLKGFFFVSTGWYKYQRMLQVHRIHLLLGKFGGDLILEHLKAIIQPAMISHEQQENYSRFNYPNQQNDEATLAVKQLLNFYIESEHQSGVLDELMKRTGLDEAEEGARFYLGKADILAMQSAGMIIGSHTENHPVLSKLSYTEQKKEILQGVEYFENGLGLAKPTSFCYPYGYAGTYNADSIQTLQSNGFTNAFVVDAREVTTDDLLNHPLTLPRFDCNMFPHGKVWRG